MPINIEQIYADYPQKLQQARKIVGHPLTLTEKILYSHFAHPITQKASRGETYADFSVDRVSMQDATAQMALLQFICTNKNQTAVPTTIHCDHLIQAEFGSQPDLSRANKESKEIFDFLESVASKYDMGFWRPGAGIIHQVVLENYAFPGGMMIGTDSHTPNGGGLGMIAIGVGGADAVDAMTGQPWELPFPKVLGVHLKGKMSGWTSAKDVILKVAGILTTKGGTGYILEYFGEGTSSISCTGKGTICNMGAEIGATTSLFPFDERMADYLNATGRQHIAELAKKHRDCLCPDEEVLRDPDKYYDKVIEIDLSQLEPHVNGPYSPDKCWSISEFSQAVKDNDYPAKFKIALIGSCTNSSYEDIQRAASIARQARAHGIQAKTDLGINPGSEMIRSTIERDGFIDELTAVGAKIFANACGPCIGQWKRHDVKHGEKNSIINSYNRNFAGRNDANPGTHAFMASPEIVMAFALAGTFHFNPLVDPLIDENGKEFLLNPPEGEELPSRGFAEGDFGYVPPTEAEAEAGAQLPIKVKVDPDSERLHLLEPFPKWDGQDLTEMRVLVKAKGKCTTDHISPAGKWLRFRGHLDNISDNMFFGAVNAFRDEVGCGINLLTAAIEPFPAIARTYKERGIGWVAIGDDNYGEGSSREHAAMSPRHLGCKAVIARSFARIHETNLKKQGVLALTFADPADYDKVREDDLIAIRGLGSFAPKKNLELVLTHTDDSEEHLSAHHTYNDKQIGWFRAGSSIGS